MSTARELMHSSAKCVRTDQTAADAARMMTELGVGGLPICGADDNRVKGMVTDRDLVTKVVGQGRDAGTFPAGDLNQNEAATIGADDSAEEVVATMTRHQVRRLPVIDQQRLVGVISLADIAVSQSHTEIGKLVEKLSVD